MTVNTKKFPYNLGFRNASFPFPASYAIVVNSKCVPLNLAVIVYKTLIDLPLSFVDINADVLDLQDDGVNGHIANASGKALLMRVGSVPGSCICCNNAADSGAIACILYSFDYMNSWFLDGILGSFRIPALVTTREAGQAIISNLKGGKTPFVNVVVTNSFGELPVITA